MRRIFGGGKYANVTSTLALVLALGGASAYAANTIRSSDIVNGQVKRADIANNAVTSGKVKNGVLLAKDFKAGELKAGPTGPTGPRGFTGAQGAKGDTGTPGAIGPSNAFTFSHDAAIALPNTATPLSAPVGAGSYFIVATLEINNNSAASARPNCTLTAGGDSQSALMGTSENARNDDTESGALSLSHTFAAPGAITLACDDGGQPTMILSKVKLTAVKVGTATDTAF